MYLALPENDPVTAGISVNKSTSIPPSRVVLLWRVYHDYLTSLFSFAPEGPFQNLINVTLGLHMSDTYRLCYPDPYSVIIQFIYLLVGSRFLPPGFPLLFGLISSGLGCVCVIHCLAPQCPCLPTNGMNIGDYDF